MPTPDAKLRSDMSPYRQVQVGPWLATLHAPVLICQGQSGQHITRPNLCRLDGAIAAIFQTTFDTSATPRDRRDIFVSTDHGKSWWPAQRQVEVGSYSLYSPGQGPAVVMPYDSIRLGPTADTLTGPRSVLSWKDGKLGVEQGRTLARFPRPLMTFLPEPIMGEDGRPMYLENDLPPGDKPITAFWGTIQALPDGRWIAPAYGAYADDPRAIHSPAPEMRRMARYTSELLESADQGRNWSWLGRIAGPGDVSGDCVEGPSEVQLFRHHGVWRAVFRVSALKGFFQPMHYADSADQGHTWTQPRVLPGVDMIMDPRGLMLEGLTVLSAGRPKIGLYLAAGASLDFHKVDLTAHHNHYLPRLRTTGHTDLVPLGPRSFLLAYDYIPDGWRWPGSVFTAPDAIYGIQVDIA